MNFFFQRKIKLSIIEFSGQKSGEKAIFTVNIFFYFSFFLLDFLRLLFFSLSIRREKEDYYDSMCF